MDPEGLLTSLKILSSAPIMREKNQSQLQPVSLVITARFIILPWIPCVHDIHPPPNTYKFLMPAMTFKSNYYSKMLYLMILKNVVKFTSLW